MGIILIILTIVIISGTLTFITANGDHKTKIAETLACVGILSAIFSVILAMIVGISYSTYLDLKCDSVAIQQYKRAINLYTTKANVMQIDSCTITDLKYNKYQDSLVTLIQHYRTKVNEYNNKLISKREMENNFMFNWVIIGPDPDMKQIDIGI